MVMANKKKIISFQIIVHDRKMLKLRNHIDSSKGNIMSKGGDVKRHRY